MGTSPATRSPVIVSSPPPGLGPGVPDGATLPPSQGDL
jgi:hypothetical protein